MEKGLFISHRHGRRSRLFHRHLTLGALGYAYWIRGEKRKTYELGKSLLDYGEKLSNVRSMVFRPLDLRVQPFDRR